MQPYFVPYIGYFQLMHAVDVFVLYDDAQYMKGGWINRNRIRNNQNVGWLTLPVRSSNFRAPINQREYQLSSGLAIRRVKKRLEESYLKAPYGIELLPFITGLLETNVTNVAAFNAQSLNTISKALGIGCKFLTASTIDLPANLKGQAKVISLCRAIGATQYVNSVGGIDLYNEDKFQEAGVQLSFLRTTAAPTLLGNAAHYLSIIDTLLWKGIAGTREQLSNYELFSSNVELTT
ncbi:MAG TPA: WbqC family protein [Dokdonella sp.]|uniref:WbqC family protein n=1 Tax=Dokdonella sp. TaxID=2291710 RepID=UPI002D7ED2D3|nr:WbqC family protein [Dokdonella sp.]HET9034262.1 WbqC family protein [Dokdonella sp.]